MAASPDTRIRILQVSFGLNFGGAENVIVNLAKQIDPERFEMAACCTHILGPLAEVLTNDGISVTLANTGRSPYLRPLGLKRVIARFRPHIVHTHGLPALANVGPLAMFGRVPAWVHTFHYGNYPYAKRRYMFLERSYARWADQLVAVSEPQRQTLISHHGFHPDRIITLLNGVPNNPFVADRDLQLRKRQELGVSPDDVLVGTIAVLTEQKGIGFLLDAAAQVSVSLPNVKFLVAGGGHLLDALREQARARGLDSTVVFTGWRSDVAELLATMDMYVMSSLWEAMPLALLEAMAAARPIIVTDVGDNRRITLDGQAAVIVPARDGGAIAEAVRDLVRDRDKARALGQSALDAFENSYTVSRMVSRYEALYARLQ